MPRKAKSRPLSASEARGHYDGDLRQALIDAALNIVTEEQDWTFSLREVARRAGVSHNAPYNHFSDKRDLLAAVATIGFEMLRERVSSASAPIDDTVRAIHAAARAYVTLGVGNPALYRLMFGTALVGPDGSLPAEIVDAGQAAKAVLQGIIARGIERGDFVLPPGSGGDLTLAVLAAWSTVHGVTMLVIDGRARRPRSELRRIIDTVASMTVYGLAYPGHEPPRRSRKRNAA